MTTTLYQGNALEVLPRLEASRVQCVCTSPPFYGLRDYGITPSGWPDGWNGCLGLEPTPARFLSHLVQIFAQLRRVLRPDGVLWINMADSYSRNPARGGSGPNGKHDYIPSYGDARRLMSESHGSSDGRACRIPEKSLMLIPQRLAIALSDDGWIVRQVFPWIQRSAMPGSQRDRATSALQWWLMLTQQPHYYSDMEAVRKPYSLSGLNDAAHAYGWKANGHTYDAIQQGIRGAGGLNDPTRTRDKMYQHSGRTYRNTDLWMQSLTAPYGLVGVGDELVGLDCTAQARQDGHYATFAPELITPLVQQSVSAYGACGVCGAPWARDKVSKKCDTLQHGTLHLPEMSSTTSSRSLWERPPEAERASTLVPEMRCAPSKARSSEGFREREASCEAIQNEQSGKSGLAKAALSTNTTGENAEYCRNTTLFGETGSAGEKEAAASDLAKDRESQNKWSDPLQQEKSVAPQSGGGICSGRLDQDSTTTEPSLFLLQETLHQNSPSDNRSCDSVDARGKSQPNEHCSSVPRVQQSKVESSHASSLDHWIPTCPHPEAPVVPCTILDPFSGTGTTVLVAQRLGLHGIGIELSADYVAHTIERLTGDAPLLANIREGGTL